MTVSFNARFIAEDCATSLTTVKESRMSTSSAHASQQQ